MKFFKVNMLLVIVLIPAFHLSGAKKDDRWKKELYTLPYIFFNPSLGWSAGAYLGLDNYFAPESSVKLGALASVKGNFFGYLICRNIPLSNNRRLTVEPELIGGVFKNQKSFTSGNPNFPTQDFPSPGTNYSSKNNYVKAKGSDIWSEIKFRYLLPVAHGREAPKPQEVSEGFLIKKDSPELSGNFFKSGKIYLELTHFYRKSSFDTQYTDEKVKSVTSGFKFTINRENLDYRDNPSRGSSQQLSFLWDPGMLNSTAPWSLIEFSWSKYLNLKSSAPATRVLAFNIWTANCFTWNRTALSKGSNVLMRPPYFYGSTLGGRFKLRGFDENRFHDRAAILYSGEYRTILKWNPLKKMQLLKKRDINIHWIQLVLFGEAGRVGNSWNRDLLLKDLKWNIGAGLRIMMNRTLLRIDTAFGKEGGKVQMFIEHPFT